MPKPRAAFQQDSNFALRESGVNRQQNQTAKFAKFAKDKLLLGELCELCGSIAGFRRQR